MFRSIRDTAELYLCATGISLLANMFAEAVDLTTIVYPHYLSGPLDGRQRLEFLRYHMERHLAQIERVRAHPNFPR